MPLCSNCGQPHEINDNFCRLCGIPIAADVPHQFPTDIPVPASTEEANNQDVANVTRIEEIAPNDQRYALSIDISTPLTHLTAYGCALFVSLATLTFIISDDLTRQRVYLVLPAVLAASASLVLMKLCWSKWKQAPTTIDLNGTRRRARRSVTLKLATFTACGLAGAAIIGYSVGASGSETEQYVSDLAKYETIGDAISQKRDHAPNTIAGQLAMYGAIESDVNSLQPIVRRLEGENEIYAEKYPASSGTTAKSMRAFIDTDKRLALLKQQIAVAKEISLLTDAHDQVSLYRDKMLPLLNAEDGLDGR